MRVFLVPKRRKRKLWAILPFAKGREPGTGMAPPKREPAWMDALSQLFLLHYDGNESWPRHISQPIAYRGEAEEAVGLEPLAECHDRYTANLSRTINLSDFAFQVEMTILSGEEGGGPVFRAGGLPHPYGYRFFLGRQRFDLWYGFNNIALSAPLHLKADLT